MGKDTIKQEQSEHVNDAEREYLRQKSKRFKDRTTMTTLERQFAQTVAEHKSTIYTVCYMFSQDADEVNDLFHEVLVNLWKGFESFEHRSDIRTWIYRVALNTCISLDRSSLSKEERSNND